MPIYLFCKKCKATSKIGVKFCPSCGAQVPAQNKEFRVVVKFQGQVVTKVVDSLDFARRLEVKIKSELQEGRYFELHEKPMTLYETFTAYVNSKKKYHRRKTSAAYDCAL